MKLVIDTDPGIDDAMAILLAARIPGVQLMGLTTVFGNVHVAQATRNALDLLERAGLDLPVAEGAGKPLALPPITPSAHVHGPEGYGDLPAPRPRGRASAETAAEFLCRLARENKGELVVCPVGPITNIAEALRRDPAFAQNVKRIVFMGGALDHRGNITAFAEANTYHDPHALEEVLQSGAPITMVGLDVTLQVLLEAADFDELAVEAPEFGPFLRDLGRFYLQFYRSVGLSGCGLHDPMAVLACCYPALFRAERTPVAVMLSGPEIGATRRAEGALAARPPIDVLLGCDGPQIHRLFVDLLAGRGPAPSF